MILDTFIPHEDLEITQERRGHAGGQQVALTSYTVIAKHKPTGIMASSYYERSQLRNRIVVVKMLEAALKQIGYTYELPRET